MGSPAFVQKKQLYEAKVLAAKALATQLTEEAEKRKKEQYNKSNDLESVGGKCYHHADCNDADCPGWCGPFHAFQEINCCSYANTCGCECAVCKDLPIPVSALEGKRDKNGQSPAFVQKKQLYEAKVLAAKALATQLTEEAEKRKKEQYNKSNDLESVGGKCYHHADCNDADCPGWCGPFHAFQEINCCSNANTCHCECVACKEGPF